MTQRSRYTGNSPRLIIRSGGDVWIKGWDSERVQAEIKGPGGLQIKQRSGRVEIQVGGSGQVLAPYGSQVTVYCGKSAEIQEINGAVAAYAGHDLRIRQIHLLAHASAGKTLELDCDTVAGTDIQITAGQDLRCRIRQLRNARFRIDGLNGKWESVLGDGSVQVRLKAGGDVTLVTEHKLTNHAPDYLVGNVIPPQGDAPPG
jgi:hypothetical protein